MNALHSLAFPWKAREQRLLGCLGRRFLINLLSRAMYARRMKEILFYQSRDSIFLAPRRIPYK